MYTDPIIAEIHQAINRLGGSPQPRTPNDADRALRDLGADIDLISIVDSWQDTLADEDILEPPEELERRGSAVPDCLRLKAPGRRLTTLCVHSF